MGDALRFFPLFHTQTCFHQHPQNPILIHTLNSFSDNLYFCKHMPKQQQQQKKNLNNLKMFWNVYCVAANQMWDVTARVVSLKHEPAVAVCCVTTRSCGFISYPFGSLICRNTINIPEKKKWMFTVFLGLNQKFLAYMYFSFYKLSIFLTLNNPFPFCNIQTNVSAPHVSARSLLGEALELYPSIGVLWQRPYCSSVLCNDQKPVIQATFTSFCPFLLCFPLQQLPLTLWCYKVVHVRLDLALLHPFSPCG